MWLMFPKADVYQNNGTWIPLSLVEHSGFNLVILGVEIIGDTLTCSQHPSGGDDRPATLHLPHLVGQPTLFARHDLPRPGVRNGDVPSNDCRRLRVDAIEVRLDRRLTA
ncbi:hypothetical protein PENTCL1PPCAC_14843, partial [Pristionchus entomophagus]